MIRKILVAAVVVAALSIAACGDVPPEVENARANGTPVFVGQHGKFKVYQARVADRFHDSYDDIYIVEGATTSYSQSCGKSCIETITAAAPAALTSGGGSTGQ